MAGCCCLCCSTSTQYWGIASTASCLLSDIKKLEEGQNFTEVCVQEDACIPIIGNSTLPVKGSECSSATAEGQGNRECYYCHNCFSACNAEYPSEECAGENWCTKTEDPYSCVSAATFGYVAQPCGAIANSLCDYCKPEAEPEKNINGKPNPAWQTWVETCTADYGICSGGVYCKKTEPPEAPPGGVTCYGFNPDPYNTNCSSVGGCSQDPIDCGEPPNDPCAQYHFEISGSANSFPAGEDECGNSYTYCADVCTLVIDYFTPCTPECGCLFCDCDGGNANDDCCKD